MRTPFPALGYKSRCPEARKPGFLLWRFHAKTKTKNKKEGSSILFCVSGVWHNLFSFFLFGFVSSQTQWRFERVQGALLFSSLALRRGGCFVWVRHMRKPSVVHLLSGLLHHHHFHRLGPKGTLRDVALTLTLHTVLADQLGCAQLGQQLLDGSLPDGIGSLHALRTLRLDGNSLSGKLPSSMGSLNVATDISVLGNELTATIPKSIGSLNSLKTLDLSQNKPPPQQGVQKISKALSHGKRHIFSFSSTMTAPYAQTILSTLLSAFGIHYEYFSSDLVCYTRNSFKILCGKGKNIVSSAGTTTVLPPVHCRWRNTEQYQQQQTQQQEQEQEKKHEQQKQHSQHASVQQSNLI